MHSIAPTAITTQVSYDMSLPTSRFPKVIPRGIQTQPLERNRCRQYWPK